MGDSDRVLRGGVRWVVDTGASRHVCSPDVAARSLRPSDVAVETANGRVTAVGEATVHVPALGVTVDALVLENAPCLLSAGQLAEQGYELFWSRGSCTLTTPAGQKVNLEVTGGIPMLREPSADKGGQHCSSEQAHAIRSGISDTHRQVGHYPWRNDCGVCAEAALRSTPHYRRTPHCGVLAVDIVSLSQQGPHVLVRATQAPGRTYAQPLRSRAANDLRSPVLKMILDARERGEVTAVHADREAGLAALEGELLKMSVRLTVTQGQDPQANGTAENAVGRLCRMARAVLHHYDDGVARKLWQAAIVWGAQRIADPKLPPFGARVYVRHAPAALLGKLQARACAGRVPAPLPAHSGCCCDRHHA